MNGLKVECVAARLLPLTGLPSSLSRLKAPRESRVKNDTDEHEPEPSSSASIHGILPLELKSYGQLNLAFPEEKAIRKITGRAKRRIESSDHVRARS